MKAQKKLKNQYKIWKLAERRFMNKKNDKPNWKTLFFAKLKSPTLWTGVGSAIVILLNSFGVDMGGEVFEIVLNVVCGLFVILGIFADNGIASEVVKNILHIKGSIEKIDKNEDDENEICKENSMNKSESNPQENL